MLAEGIRPQRSHSSQPPSPSLFPGNTHSLTRAGRVGDHPKKELQTEKGAREEGGGALVFVLTLHKRTLETPVKILPFSWNTVESLPPCENGREILFSTFPPLWLWRRRSRTLLVASPRCRLCKLRVESLPLFPLRTNQAVDAARKGFWDYRENFFTFGWCLRADTEGGFPRKTCKTPA